MFEKEAEEYVNEEYDSCYCPDDNFSTRKNAEHDWQAGAEFGYNEGINVVLSKLSHHERVRVKALLKEAK